MMRGGYLHEYIIEMLIREFRESGLQVRQQVPVFSNELIGYVDLVVENEAGQMIALEIENSTERIFADVQKSIHLPARLWIVTPNHRLRETIRRRLHDSIFRQSDFISVLTLSQAVHTVRNKILFSFHPKWEGKEK